MSFFLVYQGRHNPLANSTLSETSSSTLNNKEWEVTAEDLENDDSPSLPVEVTLPRLHDGKYKVTNAP